LAWETAVSSGVIVNKPLLPFTITMVPFLMLSTLSPALTMAGRLRARAMMRYLQNKINNQQLQGSFDLWSVGCATGEEAYSLAMVINDCFELAALDPYYGITGLDISASALSKARAGRYSARKLDEVKHEEIKRYMQQRADGSYEVIAKLRDRVCFTHCNLVRAGSMPAVKVDIIFCQNLLVYFRRWLRRDILNALVERLKPGGLLVIGLGEVVDWEHPRMQRIALDEVQAYLRDERE
jgi:chemotaxis protein methyltransferase CheR/type IV pilus assembly protein PilK